jgi:hypothetical protein
MSSAGNNRDPTLKSTTTISCSFSVNTEKEPTYYNRYLLCPIVFTGYLLCPIIPEGPKYSELAQVRIGKMSASKIPDFTIILLI